MANPQKGENELMKAWEGAAEGDMSVSSHLDSVLSEFMSGMTEDYDPNQMVDVGSIESNDQTSDGPEMGSEGKSNDQSQEFADGGGSDEGLNEISPA